MKPEPLRREIDFDEMEAIALAFRHTVKQEKHRELLKMRNEVIGYLLLTTGLRASELLSLKFEDFINKTYIEVQGKRKQWRRVPLTTKTLSLIDRLSELLRIENKTRNYICFNLRDDSQPITYENLRLITKSAVSQLSKEKMPPHWFRRSFITQMLSHGIPLYEVMQVVGHQSINTTNHYLQDNKNSIIYKQFNNVFE